MKLTELFSLEDFAKAKDDGLIRIQFHPAQPLAIANYTERAQFSRTWNAVTTQCRGLIYNTDTLEVVARPFDKFFNYGERDIDSAHYSSPVVVTDKLDGSLGIAYPDPTNARGWSIATRGSFTSDQAIEGTQILHRYIDRGWTPEKEYTYLFEIIYPENRIVLDYGQMEDLVLLGKRHIAGGWTASGPRAVVQGGASWLGPIATEMPFFTFQQAIEAPPRPNKEGVVVHFLHNDQRLKIKQEDYVALHRLVTGLNERRVWEMMSLGKSLMDICEPLPEEFHPWVQQVGRDLIQREDKIITAVMDEYDDIMNALDRAGHFEDERLTSVSRKEFALLANKTKYAGLLFSMLDGKDIGPMVFKSLRPEATRSQFAQTEDTA